MGKRTKIAAWVLDRYHKYLPKAHHLEDTILHSIIGERLFDESIWKLERKSVIHALTLGMFVAFTPTIGLQLLTVGICAFLLRINLPSALLVVWITNPVTAIPIYSMEIKVGFWILGNGEGFKTISEMKDLLYYIEPLLVGTTVVSTFLAAATYVVMNILWNIVETAWEKGHHEAKKDL